VVVEVRIAGSSKRKRQVFVTMARRIAGGGGYCWVKWGRLVRAWSELLRQCCGVLGQSRAGRNFHTI
jgi:hypothetical protein